MNKRNAFSSFIVLIASVIMLFMGAVSALAMNFDRPTSSPIPASLSKPQHKCSPACRIHNAVPKRMVQRAHFKPSSR